MNELNLERRVAGTRHQENAFHDAPLPAGVPWQVEEPGIENLELLL
jgi:hypothetical protein